MLGSTRDFATNTRGFCLNVANTYDGIVKTTVAFKPLIFLTRTDLQHEVLLGKQKYFEKSFAYDGLKLVLGKGLLTAEGAEWLENRRKMQPFFGKQNYEIWFARMDRDITHYFEELKSNKNHSKSFDSDVNLLFESKKELKKITSKLVLTVLFEKTYSGEESELEVDIDALRFYANEKLKNPFMLPLVFPTRKNRAFKSIRIRLFKKIEKIIDERIKSGAVNDDLLQCLITTFYEENNPQSLNHIRDELTTFYLAGQETSASAIGFLMYLLACNKSYIKRLRKEITEAPPGLTSFFELKLLHNCINEALRIFPPAWAISRRCVKSVEIGSYLIPENSTVFLPIYVLHHDKEYWKDPEIFRPERFDELEKNSKYFMPFGSGARMCIGSHFALMEIGLFMSHLIKNFHFDLDADQNYSVITPLTLIFKNEVKFKLTPITDQDG